MSWHAGHKCRVLLLAISVTTLLEFHEVVNSLLSVCCLPSCAYYQVMMPKKAADSRALQKATLAGVVYDKVPS